MPWIIDYPLVLDQMKHQGLRSLYYNSGAFGFSDTTNVKAIGWIGPDDPTLRPAARDAARRVTEPYEPTLADLAAHAWQAHLPGTAWILPMSHWAYELDFGSAQWLPGALEHINIDPGQLQSRTTGCAIEFTPDETKPFRYLLLRLLEMLQTSDFAIAFPNRPALCTVHHHKQLWWTTPDPTIYTALDTIVARS